MSDYVFQNLKFKKLSLHKTENIVLFYWIEHPSWSCLKLPFIASAVYAKIIALSYIKICPVLSCKNGQKWPKMLSSAWIRTRVLPERKKSENFLSKSLPLNQRGWYRLLRYFFSWKNEYSKFTLLDVKQKQLRIRIVGNLSKLTISWKQIAEFKFKIHLLSTSIYIHLKMASESMQN